MPSARLRWPRRRSGRSRPTRRRRSQRSATPSSTTPSASRSRDGASGTRQSRSCARCGARRRGAGGVRAPRRDEPGHRRHGRDAGRAACARALLEDVDAVAARARGSPASTGTRRWSARTLLQQALPTTFGLKAAGWLVGVVESRRLVVEARGRLAVQLGGAAGTLASLGEDGPRVLAGDGARARAGRAHAALAHDARARWPSSPRRWSPCRGRSRRSRSTSSCWRRPRSPRSRSRRAGPGWLVDAAAQAQSGRVDARAGMRSSRARLCGPARGCARAGARARGRRLARRVGRSCRCARVDRGGGRLAAPRARGARRPAAADALEPGAHPRPDHGRAPGAHPRWTRLGRSEARTIVAAAAERAGDRDTRFGDELAADDRVPLSRGRARACARSGRVPGLGEGVRRPGARALRRLSGGPARGLERVLPATGRTRPCSIASRNATRKRPGPRGAGAQGSRQRRAVERAIRRAAHDRVHLALQLARIDAVGGPDHMRGA